VTAPEAADRPLSRAEIRTALRRLRERAGIKPPRRTLQQAYNEGVAKGVELCMRQLAKIATEKETTNE